MPRYLLYAELGYLSCVVVSCYVERQYLRLGIGNIPSLLILVDFVSSYLGPIGFWGNIFFLIISYKMLPAPNERD
jgi:hypothetical protein